MTTRTPRAPRTPRAARPADRLAAALTSALAARLGDPGRGDVPGWVLVTVMTAGLVVGLAAVAGPALQDVFTSAVQSVSVP